MKAYSLKLRHEDAAGNIQCGYVPGVQVDDVRVTNGAAEFLLEGKVVFTLAPGEWLSVRRAHEFMQAEGGKRHLVAGID